MKAVLTDLSVLSSLLLIGIFLRKKVKLFQDIYIPASLLAGFVGLIFGSQILGKISPVCIPISDTVSGWAGQLVNIVLGLSFLGNTESKKDFGRTALSFAVAPIVLLGGSFALWVVFFIIARVFFWHPERKFSQIVLGNSDLPKQNKSSKEG